MELLSRYKNFIGGVLVGSLVVYAVAQFYTTKKLTQLEVSLTHSIEKEMNEVRDLVEIIGSGGVTRSAEVTIIDCSPEERELFETRLGQLDSGLNSSDLEEIDFLFSRCAPVHAVRRALVVLDFSRQLESLESLIAQRKQIDSFEKFDDLLSDLKALLKVEEDITRLSLDIVYLQREILDKLLSGARVAGADLDSQREAGAKLRQELQRAATDAHDLRKSLSESWNG